jgi:hypothetical protein
MQIADNHHAKQILFAEWKLAWGFVYLTLGTAQGKRKIDSSKKVAGSFRSSAAQGKQKLILPPDQAIWSEIHKRIQENT